MKHAPRKQMIEIWEQTPTLLFKKKKKKNEKYHWTC